MEVEKKAGNEEEEEEEEEEGEEEEEDGEEEEEQQKTVKDEDEKKKDDAAAGSNHGGENDEKGAEEKVPPPLLAAPEMVMRVHMHCEGCARKVRRCLKGFPGVEDVMTNTRANMVVVKGAVAAAEPLKVVERVRKKTGRKIELISPLPVPKPEKMIAEVSKQCEEKPPPKPEVEVPPAMISVAINLHMHCDGCARKIKKRILKMQGVKTAEADLKSSQVIVQGVFNPSNLIEYVYKLTGKHAVIAKTDLADKNPEAKPEKSVNVVGAKESEQMNGDDRDKKAESGDKGNSREVKVATKDTGKKGSAKDGDDPGIESSTAEAAESMAANTEPMNNNGFYQRQAYQHHYYYYPPPQIFSDENPNACCMM